MRIVVSVAVTVLVASSIVGNALADCGSRGGPGYRGPNGRCVGWADIGRTCGSPPTTRCTAEGAAIGAEEAAAAGASHQDKVEGLRSAAAKKGLGAK
jgi:hypothetical protein